jgi:predicted nucleic-acid-binding Zn-ribbon protein
VSDQADVGDVEHLGKLFRKSFPDVGCLRCGNDEFFILPATREEFWPQSASRPTFLQVTTLACTRCGYIEQHLTEQLEKASKPIEITKSSTP